MPEKSENLLKELLEYYPVPEHKGLREVYEFTRRAHEGQFRQTGEIFLHHPMYVALILAQLGFDLDTVKASMLHDILEDCHISYEELEKTFGSSLAKIVNGVTKITALDNEIVGEQDKKEHTRYESFLKFIFAISEDIRVVVVKLADRLHNLRTLMGMKVEKQKKIAQETMDIYVPLANRLGLTMLKNEMEDLCLKYLEPKSYYKIKHLLEEKRAQREENIQIAKKYLEEKFTPYNVPVRIEGRPKHFYSIFKKMMKRRLSFDEIFDLLGLRLITDTKEHCYLLLGIIHDVWQPSGNRFKDYIASPKPNNYQSLHTTVIDSEGNLIEIQIRTEEMNRIAEKGIAAHWRYKEEDQISLRDQSFYNFLLELIESTQQEKNARESYNNIKNNLLVNTIFVRTPQGKVIELPRGSTPVDFAYAIHTEVGNTCVGAKVNGRLVSLSYKLKTEDVVRIVTNKQSHPSPDWLEFVASSRARNKVRYWIRQSRTDLYLQEGKNILQKSLKSIPSLNLSLNQFIKHYLTLVNLQRMNYPDVDTLLVDIGQNQLKITTLFSKLKLYETEKTEKAVEKKELSPEIITERLTDRIGGVDNIQTHIAGCCLPRPGSPIEGIITSAKQVSIHRKDCPNISRISPHKKLPVQWISMSEKTPVKHWMTEIGVFLDKESLDSFEKLFHLSFYFAKCCKPQLSDQIKGFYSSIRRGISVHKSECFYISRRSNNTSSILHLLPPDKKATRVKMQVEFPSLKLVHRFLQKLLPFKILVYSFDRSGVGKIIQLNMGFSILELNNSGFSDTINSIKSEIINLHGKNKVHFKIQHVSSHNSTP